MHFKPLSCAVGMAIHVVSIIALPIAGQIDAEISMHPSQRDREGVSSRSPEDVVPVADCKRAPAAKTNFNEALHRRCGEEGEGEGEGEEEKEPDGGGGDNDDDEDGDAENIQTASNSPRQDCILTQMALFPMPNFGLCESLPDTPPTTDPAPPVTPDPAPVTPPPPAELVPAPAHKPVPVNAGGPARATP